MTPFPVAEGIPSHSGTLIPTIFSKKTVAKFYNASTFANITNIDYQGEISGQGDKVIINIIPDITVRTYVKGMNLVVENPGSSTVTLNIDQAEYFAANAFKVDKVQSALNFVEKWSADVAQKMKNAIDAKIFAGVYADSHAANQGNTAGLVSASYNMGSTGTPRSLTDSTILDAIVDCGSVMDEQNLPDTGRFLVLPAWACGMIKKSDLANASFSGDSSSIVRGGRLGTIDRFTLYMSNNVYKNASAQFFPLFGTKDAIAFASQIALTETIDNQNDFGEILRGLQVYGYKTVCPAALGTMCITKGA